MLDAARRGTRTILPTLVILTLLPLLEAATAHAQGTPAPAPPQKVPLPPGILRVFFGTAVRDRSVTGLERCTIPEPLPTPPRFEPDTMEIAYTILVDPKLVKGVTAKVVGDLGCPEPWTRGCIGYTLCDGSVCQNQYGATLSCPNGKALKKGAYKLSLTVGGAGGKTAELPFEIQ